MADHSEVAYTTADGNDYREHESTYEGFTHYSFVGALHVISVVLGIGIVGITSHWIIGALVIFVIATIGLVHGLATGTRAGIVTAFVISALLFTYSVLS
jgi:hypothetical protein